MKPQPAALIAAVALAAPALTLPGLCLPATGQQADAVWRSTTGQPQQLSEELSTLYLSLYNAGKLPVRQVVMGSQPYAELVLRDEGVWPGAFLPLAMDAMMCDLNPAICSRAQVPVDLRDQRVGDSHVGGYAPSEGQWRAQAGDTLTIPDLTPKPFTTLSRIPAVPGWTAEGMTLDLRLDCSKWGMDCAAVVRQYNPAAAKAPAGWGQDSITVPVVRYEAVLDNLPLVAPEPPPPADPLILRAPEADLPPGTGAMPGMAADMTAVPADLATASMDFTTGDISVTLTSDDMPGQAAFAPLDPVPPAPVQLNLRPPAPPVPTEADQLEVLRQNLLPQRSFLRYGFTPGAFYPDQRPLFELIDHPFGKAQDLPAMASHPVTVLVIDRRPPAAHCNWDTAYVWENGQLHSLPVPPLPELPGELPPPGDGCWQPQITQDLGANDHPVGIGGLIAARPGRHGISGLNPFAELVYLGLEDEQVRTLNDKLDTLPLQARVANISIGVIPDNNAFRDMRDKLSSYLGTMLFVVAAGNERDDLSQRCLIMPACATDLDNVVTVVGLNDNADEPGLWQVEGGGIGPALARGTNTSPDFDIGAIATPVLTTASGNRMGWQGGTSFAAPQVTAAASLIFAAAEEGFIDRPGARIAPKIVRDRLVYTADLMPGYADSVLSGRLNVDRAIDVNHVRITLRDGREFSGLLQRVPRWYTCIAQGDDEETGYSWWWLRRIVFDKNRNQWMLIRHTGPDPTEGARFTPLEHTGWCTLDDASNTQMKILTDDGTSHTFTLTEIADYTSRLFN